MIYLRFCHRLMFNTGDSLADDDPGPETDCLLNSGNNLEAAKCSGKGCCQQFGGDNFAQNIH